MGLICRIGGHRASSETIRNAGRHFSRCTRCSSDLVEEDGAWATAPAGFRIVWKKLPDPFVAPDAEEDVFTCAAPSEEPESQAGPEWPIAAMAARVERRRADGPAKLPAFLGGRDRRRASFGRKAPLS